ncbi:MAG: hypothetical protein MK319_00530 [Pseudomonadales bacterium]|nr:hypothetical protein [Pseudomonadales bacterium]
MARKHRRIIDITLTGLGIGLIFTVVLLSGSLTLQVQMPLAVLGVLLMEAGVWGMSNKFLPNERRFSGLREEGDRMLDLMRELCSAAVARDRGGEDDQRFQAAREKMHTSVESMAAIASHDSESGPVPSAPPSTQNP